MSELADAVPARSSIELSFELGWQIPLLLGLSVEHRDAPRADAGAGLLLRTVAFRARSLGARSTMLDLLIEEQRHHELNPRDLADAVVEVHGQLAASVHDLGEKEPVAYEIGRSLGELAALSASKFDRARLLRRLLEPSRLLGVVVSLSLLEADLPENAALAAATGLWAWSHYVEGASASQLLECNGELRAQTKCWHDLLSGRVPVAALAVDRDKAHLPPFSSNSGELEKRLAERSLDAFFARTDDELLAVAASVLVPRNSHEEVLEAEAPGAGPATLAGPLEKKTAAASADAVQGDKAQIEEQRDLSFGDTALKDQKSTTRAATASMKAGAEKSAPGDAEPLQIEEQTAPSFGDSALTQKESSSPAGAGPQPGVTAPPEEQQGVPASLPVAGETEDELVAPTPTSRARRLRRLGLEWLGVLVLAGALAFLVRTFVFQSFYVSSGSMTPTLITGDRVLVDKLPFVTDDIHRGDIIVFHRVASDRTPPMVADLVKRVIGLPGDRISSSGDEIFVDGHELQEPWLAALSGMCATSAYDIKAQTIPPHHYFVLGDCRGDSLDSRVWGTVPAKNIIGKVFLVYWRNSHPVFDWF